MAASEALLTWGGLATVEEEESSMDGLRARLEAMTFAVRAKDAELQDLHRRLQAALGEVEQGRVKEAAMRRRAEIAEAAEEALASQMAELEAEAYESIMQSHKMQKVAVQPAEDSWMANWEETKGGRQRIEELERRLEAAMEEAGGWQRRYREAEAEASIYKAAGREAPTRARRVETTDAVAGGHVTDLQRRLVEAERALEEAHAKLQQRAEEKVSGQQMMSVKRKGEMEADDAVVSMSLQELAGMVKLRLWSPSSLTVRST